MHDLRCDRCGAALAGPSGSAATHGRLGVRFTYHPGAPALKDDAGLMCEACWSEVLAWLGTPGGSGDRCTRCREALDDGRLVVLRQGELVSWSLCRTDAVGFLNGLRTVDPKLDDATFRFPAGR